MEDLLQAATYLQSPSILAECCKARLCQACVQAAPLPGKTCVKHRQHAADDPAGFADSA